MPKEFKTVEELIALLESRGVVTNELTEKRLSRESYYAIINGYKNPFLDLEAMKSSSDDVYAAGVEFDWIYDLFLFDRDLRSLTFKYLTRAEACIKSAVVYSFCHSHPKESEYLDISNYCTSDDYLVPKAFKGNKKGLHQQNMVKLMKTLNEKLAPSNKTRPFVKHYLNKYGFVPLWVLSNDLTFGNIVHMYQLLEPGCREETCRIIARNCGRIAKKDGALSPRKLLRSASVLVDFRNICAHDERLYCAKPGNAAFSVMVGALADVLGKEETQQFIREVVDLFNENDGKLHSVTPESLLSEMGFAISRTK